MTFIKLFLVSFILYAINTTLCVEAMKPSTSNSKIHKKKKMRRTTEDIFAQPPEHVRSSSFYRMASTSGSLEPQSSFAALFPPPVERTPLIRLNTILLPDLTRVTREDENTDIDHEMENILPNQAAFGLPNEILHIVFDSLLPKPNDILSLAQVSKNLHDHVKYYLSCGISECDLTQLSFNKSMAFLLYMLQFPVKINEKRLPFAILNLQNKNLKKLRLKIEHPYQLAILSCFPEIKTLNFEEKNHAHLSLTIPQKLGTLSSELPNFSKCLSLKKLKTLIIHTHVFDRTHFSSITHYIKSLIKNAPQLESLSILEKIDNLKVFPQNESAKQQNLILSFLNMGTNLSELKSLSLFSIEPITIVDALNSLLHSQKYRNLSSFDLDYFLKDYAHLSFTNQYLKFVKENSQTLRVLNFSNIHFHPAIFTLNQFLRGAVFPNVSTLVITNHEVYVIFKTLFQMSSINYHAHFPQLKNIKIYLKSYHGVSHLRQTDFLSLFHSFFNSDLFMGLESFTFLKNFFFLAGDDKFETPGQFDLESKIIRDALTKKRDLGKKFEVDIMADFLISPET